jgi:alpha-2-macroglobulin
VDLSLRTAGGLPGPGAADSAGMEDDGGDDAGMETPGGHERWDSRWAYGSWDAGWWTPFEHRELRDDRVVWFATVLWPGSYTASYVARATTPGTFRRPPAHAEEMYDRAVNGRSDGGAFEVTAK